MIAIGILAAAVAAFAALPRTIVGHKDPHRLELAALAPADARIDSAWYVRRSGGEPPQVLVEWHHVEALAPKGGPPYPNVVWRLVLWTPTPNRGYETRWRPRFLIGGPQALQPIYSVGLADLTGDGHPEVLVEDYRGNHGCGPRRIVATIRFRPRAIFDGDWCETDWWVRRGALRIREAQYAPGDSLCCASFERYATYRWNGRRLVVAQSRVVRNRLD